MNIGALLNFAMPDDTTLLRRSRPDSGSSYYPKYGPETRAHARELLRVYQEFSRG